MKLAKHTTLAVIVALVALLLLGTGCSAWVRGSQPARKPAQVFRYGTLLLDEPFTTAGAWRRLQSPQLQMGQAAGAYRIDISRRGYVWAQSSLASEDMVLEANIAQLQPHASGYGGIACRLDAADSGRGYFFLISADGYASIRWANGRSLEPLLAPQFVPAIRQGSARNRLRALCIGQTLSMWVNDSFVAELQDERAAAGYAGIVAALNRERAAMQLAVDNFKLWRAEWHSRSSG